MPPSLNAIRTVGNRNGISDHSHSAHAISACEPNSVAGSFEIVSDARLDDASTSIWYGSADPSTNDTVIVEELSYGAMVKKIRTAGAWLEMAKDLGAGPVTRVPF